MGMMPADAQHVDQTTPLLLGLDHRGKFEPDVTVSAVRAATV